MVKFIPPEPVYYWIGDEMKVICGNCRHSINYHNAETEPLCFYENCDCIEAIPRVVEMFGVEDKW